MDELYRERLREAVLASPAVYAVARDIADARRIQTMSAWIPVSLEAAADMGLPLTDEERAILAQRDADRAAYRRSWRYRRYLLMRPLYTAKHRLSRALDALRGVELERDDY